MANPIIVQCPKGVWIKVATNFLTGAVLPLTAIGSDSLTPLYTYRTTGGPAPTSPDEGFPLVDVASMPTGIDVYIMYTKLDGKVRVDV